MTRPRVLVVADYYLPGFRAGGPVRAISNAIDRLASSAEFFVVTRDHDADGSAYGDIDVGRWNGRTPAPVLYARRLAPGLLRRCVSEMGCDVIWLNSLFSTASIGVLVFRRLGRIRTPILLAPRGELSPGALALKPWRKAVAVQMLRRSGCLRSIRWLASSELERQDITRAMGRQPITCVAESVSNVPEGGQPWPAKWPRRLRAVFASRIAPKKNLLFLLEVLAACDGDIHLDVIGPLEDEDYWARCEAQIARLPGHVTVAYAGELPHRDLQRCLPTYDLLILPTLGENFGHIVVEAWAAGCPVLVSDRTPWRDLTASGVGWDVPLDRGAWTAAIGEALAMGAEAHLAMRRRGREQARRVWREGIAGDRALLRVIDELRRTGAPHTQAPHEGAPCAGRMVRANDAD
jgi:glycosyltransferase involved in cell wall biosynthesis